MRSMDDAGSKRTLAIGTSLGEIADRLGPTQSTAGKTAKEHGIDLPGRVKYGAKPIPANELRALVAEGATQRELARHFGVSVTTIRRRLTRMGMRTRGRARRRPPEVGAPRERPGACQVHGRTTFCLDSRGTWRCRRCRSDAVARRRRKVKELLVAEAGGECGLCGYNRYSGALHFHHLDPDSKRFGLGQGGWTRGIRELRAEARKCVLLCSNCHAEVEAAIVEPPHARATQARGGTVGGSSIGRAAPC